VASDFTSPVGFYEVTLVHFDVVLLAFDLIAILMLSVA